MKKILHLIHTPRHSGAEALVRDLCMMHSSWGAQCAIAAFEPMTAEFEIDSQHLVASSTQLYFPPRGLRKFERIKHYRKAIRSFAPDAIFAHSVLPSLYGRLAMPFFGDKPKYVTVLHAASNDDFAGIYLNVAEHLLRWRTNQVIAVSKLGARNYIRRFGTAVPVEVVPNGIDIEKFQGVNRDAARKKFGAAADRKIALQVGRLSKIKQQDLSIRALAGYLKSNNAELWLAGLTEDPEYEAELHKIVIEEGLTDKVHFLGSRSDLPDLMAAADLYLMPSKAEAHSIAVLEALASGLPMVLSQISAFETFLGLESVELVPTTNPHDLRDKAEALIGTGHVRRNVQRYSIQNTAKIYSILCQ